MTRIREIIEAAIGKVSYDCDTCMSAVSEDDCDKCQSDSTAVFVYQRTFDPEHQLLIEDVVDGVLTWWADGDNQALRDKVGRLQAYRRERGLL